MSDETNPTLESLQAGLDALKREKVERNRPRIVLPKPPAPIIETETEPEETKMAKEETTEVVEEAKVNELETLRNRQMLLEQTLSRGLTLADTEGIEFETASELMLKLDAIVSQREIERLTALAEGNEAAGETDNSQQDESADESTDEEDSVKVDTGISTGESSESKQTVSQQLRDEAERFRKARRWNEAAQAALDAAYLDPSRVVKKN